MNDFDILGAAASGMQAQRAAMDVDARNVALAQTGDARHPAHGLVPQFASVMDGDDGAATPGASDVTALEARLDGAFDGGPAPMNSSDGAVVAFTGVHASAGPIDSISEMINVLDAQRAYEADSSVFDAGKRLFERTIDMGRL